MIAVRPRDRYGSPLGPGQPDLFDATAQDNGDGSYNIPVAWDPNLPVPGLVVTQPNRDPVPLEPATPTTGHWPQGFLGWLLLTLLVVIVALAVSLAIALQD